MLCILAALSAAGAWHGSAYGSTAELCGTVLALWGLFGGAWLLIARRLGAHSVPSNRNLTLSLRRTLESWAATWGIAGLFVVTTIAPAHLQIWMVLVVGAALLAFLRLATSFSVAGDTTDRLRAIVIGSCPSARALTSTRDAAEAFEFLGFVPFTNEDPHNMPHLPKLGQVADLADKLREHEIDAAFVSPSDDAITGEVHLAMDTCESLGLQTQYFPSFLDVDDMRVGMTWSANRPGLNVQAIGEQSLAAIGKRAIDIVGATVGLILLLPVFVACAIAVKLSSAGPILYRQTRVGKSGRSFNCLKFRTMKVGAHAQQELLRAASQQDGPAFKIAGDPRITRVGRILRKFSLDELPQLFNVLLGDMSLVGPRPPIPSEVDKYTWWQRRRISIKPGLTCVWQVYGRNRVSFKRWVEMDLYYIDNWSLWLDLKLIMHTLRVVVRGTGM
ncbi:MAG: sugar transferase [Planctomycetes bacterium]|nr:sugar transferase [Planctomycetota bacterium]